MRIEWVRTWPKTIQEGRVGYVVDDLRHVVIDNYDASPLCELELDGVLLLEWDMALSPEASYHFERKCREHPERVRVAPYRGYGLSIGGHWLPWHGTGIEDVAYVETGAPTCDGFGFGCTYLPMAMLRRWRDECEGPLDDLKFSTWHIAAGLGPVPIEWSVRPAHLHFSWSRHPYRTLDHVAMVDDASHGERAMVDDLAGKRNLHQPAPEELDAEAAAQAAAEEPPAPEEAPTSRRRRK